MSLYSNILHRLDSLSDAARYLVWNNGMKKRAKGLVPLEKEQVMAVRNFYRPFKNIDLSGHVFYTRKTGVFSEYYIPDSLWYAYIDPFYNPRRLAKALDSKFFYTRLLQGGKHPNVIAYKMNGFWLSKDFRPKSIEDIASDATTSCAAIFIKQSEDSAGGHGVFYFDCKEGKEKLVEILCSVNVNVVVQEGIIQHGSMSKLNATSVNTIRVLTHINNLGGVKVRSVIVRMGRNHSHVDNASSGGITVGVDWDGRLKAVGYDVKGISYAEHPDTHTKFSDIIIPNYASLLNAISDMHWELPMFRLLSWDVAIAEDGMPIIIEVNMYSGQLDFHQLNNGPVFGNDTKAVLEEVFHTKKK